MFKLNDIRKSQVWQEARQEGHEEGLEKGLEEGRALEKHAIVRRCLTQGMTHKEIAELLAMTLAEVRRLSRR